MDQNKLTQTLQQTGNLFNIGLLLFTITPLLALAFYNHPSAADDYCFIYTVNVHGWIGGMSKYYNEWTGRYFTVFLNHSNPLLIDSFLGFKVVSMVLILLLAGTLYYLTRTLIPSLSRSTHLGFAGVILFLFLLKMPSIPEAFYWFASFVTYTVPSIMILLWIALTVKWYTSRNKKQQTRLGLYCCLLVFGAIGSSETTLLLMVVLIGAWLCFRAVIVKKPDILMMSVSATALISCYFLFAAPGNSARLGGNPVSGNIPLAALVSIKFIASSAKTWLLGTPLIFFTLCWILLLNRFRNKQFPSTFSFPLWLVILSYAGVLFAIVFPSFYAVSTELDPTHRVINSLYFFFLAGWFYLWGAVFYCTRQQGIWSILNRPFLPVLASLACALSLAFFVLRTPNFKNMYADWLKGNAAAYDREMNERYAILRDKTNPNPVISPIIHRPASLFVEDITDDPKGWWNWCMAGYFGKESITLKKESDPKKN
jgi:hypothetical protein